MAEANGVFVHLFRNKEAWKQNEGMLEIAKGKFEAEEEYRKKVAIEAGLTEDRVSANFNSNIDAKLFYPEFDVNSPEYIVWRCGLREQDSVSTTKEDLAKSDREIGWPLEVMEEMGLFNKHRIFKSYSYLNYGNEIEKYRFRLLWGIRGNKRYPVAWWGEGEYYDQIQEKLRELKEKQEADKGAEEKELLRFAKRAAYAWGFRKFPSWSVSEWIVGCTFVLLLVSGVVWFCSRGSTVSNEHVQSQVLTPHECERLHKNSTPLEYAARWGYEIYGKVIQKCARHGEHFVLDCHCSSFYAPNTVVVSREIFDKFKVGDKVSVPKEEKKEEKKEYRYSRCTTACYGHTHDSVYGLPEGKIVSKVVCPSEKHYALYIDKEDKFLYNEPIICVVSKSVFDKVKIGDKIVLQCNFPNFSSLYVLPKGKIIELAAIYEERLYDPCPLHSIHYFIWIENEETEERSYGAVNQKDFEKLKVGDSVPFKRPVY